MKCLPRGVLLTHVAATLALVGVIWFIQVVHYPLFSHVPSTAFAAYEAAHTRLTTWVVTPPMVVEAVTGVLLLWRRPEEVRLPLVWTGLGLLAIIWLSTALLQVPQHQILLSGFDPSAHRTLLLSNWIRTIAWSVRGVLVLWLVADSCR